MALKTVRQGRGLTQEQLATELGLHRHTIRAIEQGDGGVSMIDWLTICDTLGLVVTLPTQQDPVVRVYSEQQASKKNTRTLL